MGKKLKIISALLTLASVVVSLATNTLGEKMLDNKIETKIAEALAKKQ